MGLGAPNKETTGNEKEKQNHEFSLKGNKDRQEKSKLK